MFIFMYVFINSHGYSINTQSIVSKRYLLKISITLKKRHIQFIITCWVRVLQALMVRTKFKKKRYIINSRTKRILTNKNVYCYFLLFTQTRIQFSGQSPWGQVLCGFDGLDWVQCEPKQKFMVKWKNSFVTANIFEFW